MPNYDLTPRTMILALLRERNWKQTELADKIGMKKQSLHAYICGKENMTVPMKLKIAKALEVDSAVIWDFPIFAKGEKEE